MENTSPLYKWHVAADAKMADFGGWDMPIEYPKVMVGDQAGGVLAGHSAVREKITRLGQKSRQRYEPV